VRIPTHPLLPLLITPSPAAAPSLQPFAACLHVPPEALLPTDALAAFAAAVARATASASASAAASTVPAAAQPQQSDVAAAPSAAISSAMHPSLSWAACLLSEQVGAASTAAASASTAPSPGASASAGEALAAMGRDWAAAESYFNKVYSWE